MSSKRFAVPRSKVVLFRLTEDEYREIEHRAKRLGARSLSAYIRTLVIHAFKQQQKGDSEA